LKSKIVELNIVGRGCANKVGRALKNALKPHRVKQWSFHLCRDGRLFVGLQASRDKAVRNTAVAPAETRHAELAKANWHFTIEDARIKLKHLPLTF
jgi:hypothetical protein